jgi:TP901 family phage tail tape measure protein
MPIGLGSQAQLGIGISISLNNRFSAQASRINEELMQMRKNAHSALTATTREYRNQALAVAGIATAVTAGFLSFSKEGAAFQHKINQTYIVGGKALERSRRDLEGFSRQMSRTFTRDPKEIAQVMFENVKAGVGRGLEEVTKYQTAVATATDEALGGAEGVGEKLLGIANAMGIGINDQFEIGGKKMSQFARIANATTAAANATMASVYSIGESMEYFSNTAAVAGMSLEETLALVGKLSQAKITGSAAGTALNNMVQQLVQSVGPFMTKKKGKAWGMLGIDPKSIEAMINQGNTFQALEGIDKRARGLSRSDRLNVFNALFNMRGQRGMVNAFMGGDKSIASIRGEIDTGVRGDIAMKQSQAMMNDLEGDFKFFSNAMKEFKIAFTKSIEPGLRAGVKMATGILRVITKVVETPVGKFFVALIGAMAPLIAIMFTFRAAVLTATLALRTIGMTGQAGGWRGLAGGMLGSYGGMMTGARGMQGVGVNKAGRMFVNAGQTVNHGGKIYKGGQILPKSFSGAAGGLGTGFNLGNSIGNFFGMGSLAASSAGTTGAITGALTKIGPWIARIGGFALRWLPVVGWIWTAVELLRGLFGNSEDEKRERKGVDSAAMVYWRNMNDSLANQEIGKATGYSQYMGKLGSLKWSQGQGDLAPMPVNFNQSINLNVDGREALMQSIKKSMDMRNASSSDFNFTY